ncbi:MAG TPA: phage integrase N-terminal SAM-like domain-containing protein, partial [Candidatus Limnocylindrales bacterium]
MLYPLSYGRAIGRQFHAQLKRITRRPVSRRLDYTASRAYNSNRRDSNYEASASMVQATATGTIVTPGDLGVNAASFVRHLRASNLAPRTIRTYLEGVQRLADFLTAQGMPTDIAAIRREHVESWIADLLEKGKPSSAANRFRSVQQLFKWAVDEGE